MTTREDGGPAFPSHGSMGEVAHEGLSLRDYFAAKAMQAYIMKYPGLFQSENDAYAAADRMLKSRPAAAEEK